MLSDKGQRAANLLKDIKTFQSKKKKYSQLSIQRSFNSSINAPMLHMPTNLIFNGYDKKLQ